MKAVVSGATRGVGRAIAFALAKEGYDLALGARGMGELEKLKKELEKEFTCNVIVKTVDFSSSFETSNFAQSVLHAFESVDVIVNNVGQYDVGTISEEEDGELKKMLNINLNSAYFLTRPFLSTMKGKRQGHIFNICSVVSKKARREAASYTISKYALKGFNDVLREEMRDYDVKVTAIYPGSINTSSWAGMDAPKNEFVQPEDISSSIVNALNMAPGAMIEEIIINPLDRNW